MAWNVVKSGVTVLNEPCCDLKPPTELAGAVAVVGLGVDHAKEAFVFFRPGEPIGVADALSPHPPSIGLALFALERPLTSFSKSSSLAPVAASNSAPLMPPNDMKSSAGPAVDPFETPESS